MEPTLDDLTTRVFEILRDDVLVPDADFSPSSDLVDAGLDSLSVTRLLLRIEDETGIAVDERSIDRQDLASSRALANVVIERGVRA